MTLFRTIIGFGSKNQGKEKVHGAALGDEDVAFVKQKFGLDPAQKFHVADDVRKYFTELGEKGDQEYTKWRNEYEKYESKYPSEVRFRAAGFDLIFDYYSRLKNCTDASARSFQKI